MFRRLVELAEQEGVRNAENFPFWLEPGQPPRAAVVLVHGFSATPREMRPLGEALVDRGFAALGVRLPGHGTSPEDLSRRNYEEWVTTVGAALEMVALQAPRVYAAGISTGALALLAAAREHAPAGLVLLAPFLRLRHPLAPFAWFLQHFFPYQTRPLESELAPFYYARRPLHGIYQLLKLARQVGRVLPRLQSPALVLASEGDETADPTSAVILFERLGSQDKRLQMFGPEVPHTMLGADNPRREEVIDLCCEFFLRLERSAGEPRARG